MLLFKKFYILKNKFFLRKNFSTDLELVREREDQESLNKIVFEKRNFISTYTLFNKIFPKCLQYRLPKYTSKCDFSHSESKVMGFFKEPLFKEGKFRLSHGHREYCEVYSEYLMPRVRSAKFNTFRFSYWHNYSFMFKKTLFKSRYFKWSFGLSDIYSWTRLFMNKYHRLHYRKKLEDIRLFGEEGFRSNMFFIVRRQACGELSFTKPDLIYRRNYLHSIVYKAFEQIYNNINIYNVDFSKSILYIYNNIDFSIERQKKLFSFLTTIKTIIKNNNCFNDYFSYLRVFWQGYEKFIFCSKFLLPSTVYSKRKRQLLNVNHNRIKNFLNNKLLLFKRKLSKINFFNDYSKRLILSKVILSRFKLLLKKSSKNVWFYLFIKRFLNRKFFDKIGNEKIIKFIKCSNYKFLNRFGNNFIRFKKYVAKKFFLKKKFLSERILNLFRIKFRINNIYKSRLIKRRWQSWYKLIWGWRKDYANMSRKINLRKSVNCKFFVKKPVKRIKLLLNNNNLNINIKNKFDNFIKNYLGSVKNNWISDKNFYGRVKVKRNSKSIQRLALQEILKNKKIYLERKKLLLRRKKLLGKNKFFYLDKNKKIYNLKINYEKLIYPKRRIKIETGYERYAVYAGGKRFIIYKYGRKFTIRRLGKWHNITYKISYMKGNWYLNMKNKLKYKLNLIPGRKKIFNFVPWNNLFFRTGSSYQWFNNISSSEKQFPFLLKHWPINDCNSYKYIAYKTKAHDTIQDKQLWRLSISNAIDRRKKFNAFVILSKFIIHLYRNFIFYNISGNIKLHSIEISLKNILVSLFILIKSGKRKKFCHRSKLYNIYNRKISMSCLFKYLIKFS